MTKELIAYTSGAGTTEKMVNMLAEGIRMSGKEADVVNISSIEKATKVSGYDRFLFGYPTYH